MRLSTEFAVLLSYWKPDLGAFEKLRKAILGSPYLSVRPSVRPHGTARIIMKINF